MAEMVVAKIAMIFLLIQVGGGIVSNFGIYGSQSYDNTLIPPDDGSEISVGDESQENQFATITFTERIKNMVTWGWTKQFWRKLGLYNDGSQATTQQQDFTSSWDAIVLLLNTASLFFIAVGFFQLKKQQPAPI